MKCLGARASAGSAPLSLSLPPSLSLSHSLSLALALALALALSLSVSWSWCQRPREVGSNGDAVVRHGSCSLAENGLDPVFVLEGDTLLCGLAGAWARV